MPRIFKNEESNSEHGKRIRRALLSVTDKTGLVEFAQALAGFGVELVSTGGTARALREAGLAVKDISDLTGFPEMLDGRVKTLHPKVHGGLLYIRGNKEHEAAVAAHGIEPIDMVVVNLYAFEKTAAQPGVAFGHLIENIDIGGPSMVRSAAKNFEDVAIVTRVADYPALIEELKSSGGSFSRETRWRLARQAFATTAAYDTAIANTLDQIADAPPPGQALPEVSAAIELPSTLRINFPLAQSLRYGENPHQRAALYADGTGLGIAGGDAAPGQGTQLQQPRRSGRLLGAGPGVQRARRHHRQAHQSLRRGHRRNRPRSLPKGPRLRSHLSLRRRHRHQPHRGRRCRGRNRQALRRGHRRSRLHPGSSRALRRQKEPAPG